MMSNYEPSPARKEEGPTRKYANRHVGKFLQLSDLKEQTSQNFIQLIEDGRELSAKRLMLNKDLTLSKPILVLDKPRSIGMKMMVSPKRKPHVTVRDVADLLGHHYPVHVIDVEHQEELEGWTLADLVEYFEDEERLLYEDRKELLAARESNDTTSRRRRRRKAAQKCLDMTTQQRPRVLNQISLEFSKTAMSEKILSPQFVRDIDWIDHAWPRKRNADGELVRPLDEVYPNVQYYCLTSAAGCYTDFHLDFGGTSVWYHILSGEKKFCLIPPTKENLAIYEEWLCRPDQSEVFLPDLIPNQTENVLQVPLQQSQTLVIPTAWIHAVYTPKDSLVIGGNFLHGMDINLQLEVHCIESRTKVQEKFRFPFFLPINFYAGRYYLDKLRKGIMSERELKGMGSLVDALEEWWKVYRHSQSQPQLGPTVVNAATECARLSGCASVEEFLDDLRKEQERASREGIKPNPLASAKKTVSSCLGKSPSSSKPKLRLSLKGNGSAKSIEVPTPDGNSSSLAPMSDETGTKESSNKFRIVVSSSKWNATVPQQTKRPREDTEWIDDGHNVEDEWMPSPSTVKKPKKENKIRPGQQSGAAKGPKCSKPTTTTSSSKAKSSRQRLMKRFR